MNEPTWSTTLPTVSGWYWLDWIGHPDGPDIVLVDVEADSVRRIGTDCWEPLVAIPEDVTRWCGPLKPPAREEA